MTYLSRLLFFLLLIQPTYADEIRSLQRYRVTQDKSTSDNLFRRYGHDWILELQGYGTDGMIQDLADVVDAAETDGTTLEQINLVSTELEKINEKEFFGAVTATIGIPLPSFKAFATGIRPSIRAQGNVGAHLSVSDSTDLFQGIPLPPDYSVNDYTISLYVKQDWKAGLNLDLEFEDNLYGGFFIYNLNRWDRVELLQATQIATEDEVIDLDKAKNTQNTISADYTFGFRDENWDIFASVQEVKLSEVSDKIETAGDLVYDQDPLVRAHLQYSIDLSFLEVTPFAGLHWREGYDLGDGYYGGAELRAGWFPLSGVVMWDSEYLTMHPRFRLWFLEVEYAARVPLNSRVDGLKTSVLHGVQLRLVF